MPPRFSVLIPSYNHGLYIGQTIASVLRQTVKDFELIIIDDGSSDNSWSIIQAIAKNDRRVQAYRQENRGLIPTLNSLAELSKGEFIAQIDSDDMWFPQRLAWGLEDMEKNSALSATFSSFVRIDQNNFLTGNSTQFNMGEIYGKDLMASMAVQNCLCACTGIIRRTALKTAGPFARPFTLAHDWDRWLRLSLEGPLNHRPDIGALYRVHDKNQSLDVMTCYRQCLAIASELTPQVIKHYDLGPETVNQSLAHLASLALKVEDYDLMANLLREKGRTFNLDEREMVTLLQCWTITNQHELARHLARALHKKEDELRPESRDRLSAVRAALGETRVCST